MNRICLVENEEKVAAFIKKGLEEHGYRVDIASDTLEAGELLELHNYDVLLLDVMLPGMNGTDFCISLRKTNNLIPVLMLTALGTLDDKVAGLRSGADDYLVKPFRFEELLARIEALLRRHTSYTQERDFLMFNGLKLNILEKTAEREGMKITLTAKEYLLLELFMRNPLKLLSRQYIAEKVWGIDFDTGTNVIDVYVNYLRSKVDKKFDDKLIHTIVGMGYILRKNEDKK